MKKNDVPTSFDERLSRRAWITAALAATAVTAQAAGDDGGGNTALEIANEKLVNDFCAAWAKRDVEVLVPYLAENVVYQIFEGRPDLIGIEAFRKEIGPFLAKFESVQWDIVRSFAIGQIVINERVDHFNAPAGGRSMHFPIAGLFVVKNGKIALWRDYLYPAKPA